MVWVRFPVYFYKRNDIYYYCREFPSDLRHHFNKKKIVNKKKIEVSLRTKSIMLNYFRRKVKSKITSMHL